MSEGLTSSEGLTLSETKEERPTPKQSIVIVAGGGPSEVEVPVWSHTREARTTIETKEPNEEGAADSTTDNAVDDKNKNPRRSPPNAPAYSIQVDLASMKDTVYFLFPDKKDRLSRFWILLILAAIIATSGIASDSAATVIGAMIVAPLMTPILGTMLSIVLLDGKNFLFSILLCTTGIGTCILIGYVYGLALNDDIIRKENNSQVAGRVQPRLTDLIGAIARRALLGPLLSYEKILLALCRVLPFLFPWCLHFVW
jgi:hypothetical protein